LHRFPDGFIWGVATSAYQVEGAVREDGRGTSIWDTFSHSPGRTRHGDTGDIACDHYHRLEEDVELLAELGVTAYRFSIAWPRIQPEGVGPPNQAGLDHYRRLIDALLSRGIAPLVTLYHWDLPQALQDVGGWPNRDLVGRFADYAAIVAEALGGSVPLWATLNEPWVSAWLGYGSGVHAPGHVDDAEALAATHHLLLAHGLAAQAIRSAGSGEVGIVLNLTPARPASTDPEDVGAAALAEDHMNNLFLEPVFGRSYPRALLERYEKTMDLGFIRPEDLGAIATPVDFLGVNYYTRFTVTAHPRSELRATELPGSLGAWSFVPPGLGVTAMGWAIDPAGLTELLVRIHLEYAPARLFITENGAAFDDYVDPEGGVDDEERVSYLRDHLLAAHEAIRKGVPLSGYFAWSFLDNFEWAEGYAKRFGLIHVDYATQARTPKQSAGWYREVVRWGGLSPHQPSWAVSPPGGGGLG
jgi:beta-glucosidase